MEQQKKGGISFWHVLLAIAILVPVGYVIFKKKNSGEGQTETAPVANAQPAGDPVATAKEEVVNNPGFDSFFNLGFAYYQAGNYEECIKATEKALQFDSLSPRAWNNIAASYGALGKYDEEIAAAQKALAIDPNFDLAKNNLNWATQMKEGKQ